MTASAIALGKTCLAEPFEALDKPEEPGTSVARHLPQYLPTLRRYARALTGDVTAADDLVQDCVERGLAKAHLWRGGNMRAWLFTILHNLHANRIRYLACRPRFSSIDETPEQRSPDAGQLQKVIARDALAAIQHLSPAHRETLLLVAVEGMSYAEVAEIMGVPAGTVMSRLSRARHHLRELTGDIVSP